MTTPKFSADRVHRPIDDYVLCEKCGCRVRERVCPRCVPIKKDEVRQQGGGRPEYDDE